MSTYNFDTRAGTSAKTTPNPQSYKPLDVARAPKQAKRFAKIMFWITLFQIIAQALIIIAMFLIQWTVAPSSGPVSTGFTSTWQSYKIIVPAVLGVFMVGMNIYAYSHNLKDIYDMHNIVNIIWVILLLALTVWTIVDDSWYCPSKMPDFCTNTLSSTVENGYWIFSVGIWLAFIFVILDLVVMASMQKAIRLVEGGWNNVEFEAFFRNELTGSWNINGIGSKIITV